MEEPDVTWATSGFSVSHAFLYGEPKPSRFRRLFMRLHLASAPRAVPLGHIALEDEK